MRAVRHATGPPTWFTQTKRSGWLLLVLLGLWAAAVAGQTQQQTEQRAEDVGDYIVRFNAVSTDVLPAQSVRAYGIHPSRFQALLNVVVDKKQKGAKPQSVPADVEARATNLAGQLKTIELREIAEEQAIYYLGTFTISNEEVLDFELRIRPRDADELYTVRFREQFFTR